MSSYTKAQFRDELKIRSDAIKSMDNSDIEIFIDIALRVYSERLPEVRVDADNDVVGGQELYDYPASALQIIQVIDADGRNEILFTTEDGGNGDKIRLGNILRRSYNDLLQASYYSNPLMQKIVLSESGYSLFDIEYIMLQDMSSVKDTGLESLSYYVEYLTYNKKADESASQSEEEIGSAPKSITDSDATGATTTIAYSVRTDLVKRYADLAQSARDKFLDAVQKVYGTRG